MLALQITAIACMIFIGVVLLIEILALALLFRSIAGLVEEIRDRINPLVEKGNSLLITVNELAKTVQSNTEQIAKKTAQTTETVSDRMAKTSEMVQGALATPFISGISIAEGFIRGIRAWRHIRNHRRRPAGKEK